MKRIVVAVVLVCVGLSIVPKVAASDLFDSAKKDYDYQLEKYRDAYREFDLKRGQYHNLQTFASQDSMVKAASAMLTHRGDVWYTYLQALRVQLSEAEGLPLDIRDGYIQNIVDWEIVVAANKKQAETATTLESVTTTAQELDAQGLMLQSFSYEVVANLSWSHIQSALIDTSALSRQLQEAVRTQIFDEVVRTTRLNGFSEVDKSLALAQTTLDTVRQQRLRFGQAYDVSNEYKKVVDELAPAYLQVRRAYQLLRELSAGVEL